MQEQRITILDVARDAQVSPATVSRVLNGNTRVDIDLKDRVLQSVHKLSYIPNANAQSLITHNTYEIGFLVSDILNAVHHIVKHIDQLGGYCGQGQLEQQSSNGPGG